MPLQATAGAATYDAFGGGPAVAAKYIEDYFQTWLRTGTGASATVTTGINASLNKSLVWTKSRSAATDHKLTDTVRGATKGLISNTTGAETTDTNGLTAFSSTGYTIGTDTNYNNSGATYVDWQWAATPKFFDVVTYTGNGTARTISHNLGSAPGCLIVKRTDSTGDWWVWHRSFVTAGSTDYINLNSDQPKAIGGALPLWDNTVPTATGFSLSNRPEVNSNGATYVAYLFAHDAGGFGASGTDNVISCGSFTTNASGEATVNLGYEPQFLIHKASTATRDWFLFDTMRGFANGNLDDKQLYPNSSAAEGTSNFGYPTATGFQVTGELASQTYIYIAIRRGPMRTPTTGTSVYNAISRLGNGSSTQAITGVGFPPDLAVSADRERQAINPTPFVDRLRGAPNSLASASTNPEITTNLGGVSAFLQDGITAFDNTSFTNSSLGDTFITWFFRRAPGFFDVVCYTGTGSATTVSHNLGVVPEMVIVKRRDTNADWWVYDAATGNTKYQVLNSTATPTTSSTAWNNTTPTSSVFTVGTGTPVNASAGTYVAYLFATVAGVSKVFSYTGNGSSQTINCGFTAGARFVLIKRADSAGDWYVWDSARGIVASNDPHLSLNTTAAEVTTDDSVDTDNTGFVVNQVAATNVNVSSATYIGLAIA